MNEHMKDFFTSFDLSATEKNTAWACTHDGLVYRWNFVEGLTVLKRHVHGPVQSIKVEKSSTTGEDTIYTLGKSDSQWTLSSHGIIHNTLNHVVLKHKLPIRAFQIKEHGNVVVAITTSTLLVGTFNKAMTGETDPDYTWREIACTEPPTCFDVKSRKGTNGKWIVDVVVGGLRGCIFVFNDVLRRFEQVSRKDRIGSTSYIPREQQLHWHREAVGGVTWSLDGQYIVSGGKETVMVLWQLETGRKQFLPNLESPIQDIAVSPSGASYVVRLADNSVMVLSTSELSPTCHVASIQVNSFSRALLPTAHLPTVDLLHQFNAEASINQAAAIINPRSPEHLLMSCPAYQVNFSIGGPLTPAPYLQDFDIKNSVFVSRQALTRTNAINVNLGPEGNSILEPNVKCLQSSYDGRWLATIDEWYAPPADLKHLSVDEELDTPNTLECKLRFWAWDATSKQWMLNSRIDEPHRSDHEQSSQPVVALAADPISCKFSTLGVDSVVRTWVLKSKLKNGKIVRGEVGPDAKGKPRTVETWWSIEHSVPLEQAGAFDSLQSVHPDRGILAYSNDGSILAAYTHHDTFSDSSSTVHFIDTTTGHLHDTQTNLFSSPDGIHGLGFLDQYLIILGRSTAAVWDVTSFTLQHLISLTSEEISTPAYPRNPLPIPHLAINIPTHTFAIATPERSRTNRRLDVHPLLRYRTNLSIYSPISKEPVYRTTLPRTTMALISAGGIAGPSDGSGFEGHKKGYVVLDLGAEVRTVMLDTAGLNALPTPPPKSPEVIRQVPDAASQQLDAELLEAEENEDEEDDVSMVNPNDGDEDEIALPPKDVDARPVVRREQLAEVFNHPTLAMPAMGELFERVMGLYAEKPVVRSPALRGVDEEDDVDDTPLDEVVGRKMEMEDYGFTGAGARETQMVQAPGPSARNLGISRNV